MSRSCWRFYSSIEGGFCRVRALPIRWRRADDLSGDGLCRVDDGGVAPALVEEWERHTEAEFSFAAVPGDHFFLSTSRDTVLATIRESLSAVSMIAVPGRPLASSKPA